MMKIATALGLCFLLGTMTWAQGRQLNEVKETFRFIRLAESKKQLSFDEATLLKVNEILDEIEERRFALTAREQRIRARLRLQDAPSEETAGKFLDEMVDIKQKQRELETDLITQIRGLLNNRQAIEFFVFYDKFTRDVQRRIRQLQQRNNNRGNRRFQGQKN